MPGAATVIGHLTDIIFIQAVRAYISGAGECKKGLAKAITDPQIGQALALIHNAPQEPWTVASLALRAGMSRAGFAARFRELVGEPPLQYLTRWRMHKAAGMLRAGSGKPRRNRRPNRLRSRGRVQQSLQALGRTRSGGLSPKLPDGCNGLREIGRCSIGLVKARSRQRE